MSTCWEVNTRLINLACQVASLEASVVRGEQALVQAKAELEAEHFHRQDLQVKVVERDRKISTLEEENMKLLSDRRELDAQKQTLQTQLEPLLTAEKQAKTKEAQLQEQLDTALVQERHLRV
jgi:chromosome segregation ATPase